jgi:hypothetical protein
VKTKKHLRVLFCENSTKVYSTIDISNISEICDIISPGNYRGIGDLNKSAADLDKNETVLVIYSKAKTTQGQKSQNPNSPFYFLNLGAQVEPPNTASIKIQRFTQKPSHWAPTKNISTLQDQNWEDID